MKAISMKLDEGERKDVEAFLERHAEAAEGDSRIRIRGDSIALIEEYAMRAYHIGYADGHDDGFKVGHDG